MSVTFNLLQDIADIVLKNLLKISAQNVTKRSLELSNKRAVTPCSSG